MTNNHLEDMKEKEVRKVRDMEIQAIWDRLSEITKSVDLCYSRVGELEIHNEDAQGRLSSLIKDVYGVSGICERIGKLEVKSSMRDDDREELKRLNSLRESQPKINHEELERRLDSISQILFCAFDVERKKELKRAIETSAGAIRLLINDIQFPLKDKDIFKPGSRPQKFMDFNYEALRGDEVGENDPS